MYNRGAAAAAYLETAVKKMYADDKENVIPCPCVKCKNTLMFDPFRGTLLSHLLKSGFMEGYELVVPVEDDINENIPDDEWSSSGYGAVGRWLADADDALISTVHIYLQIGRAHV